MKYNLNNSIKKYKTRLIIFKFLQIYKVNYIKTFILIIKYKSLKIFLTISKILKITLI